MTYTSDEPRWWPIINTLLGYRYCTVAFSTVVVYDWALTSGQEFEMIWSRPWSLITVLYLSVRCLGVVYCGTNILIEISSVSLNDAGCNIISRLNKWTPAVVIVILGAVMIIRLHAMYQGSRKMLIFLAAIILALTITTGVVLTIADSYTRWEEFVLSGTYHCLSYYPEGNIPLLIGDDWEFVTGLAWEVLTLCLAAWIAIKHFRELQRQPTGWTVRDCFIVLIKTHVLYFAAFAVVSCFALSTLSPSAADHSPVRDEVYNGVSRILLCIQVFILGPRLIFSVRAHHAQLLANADEGTAMTTLVFQERTYKSSDGDV